MRVTELKSAICEISTVMEANKDHLTFLDQQIGDGDLGISMSNGFRSVCDYLNLHSVTHLGKALRDCGEVFNERAPSSLGTIIAFFFLGMSKSLRGKEECTFEELTEAMENGLVNVMDKAGSKPGEKTILDSLFPGIMALKENVNDPKTAFKIAAIAAKNGSEKTKDMKAVWGRAAYYGDKSIGILDGGSVVGALIFQALEQVSK